MPARTSKFSSRAVASILAMIIAASSLHSEAAFMVGHKLSNVLLQFHNLAAYHHSCHHTEIP